MAIPVDLVNGHSVLVDERSANLGGSFYMNPDLQVYSPLPMNWCYQQLMRYPSATLLDVGSSTGCFSLLSRLHPDLKVYAFEPVETTYAVLKENIYLNGLTDKVEARRLAVSNYNGMGTLHEIKDDGGKGVSMVGGVPAYHKDCNDIEIDVITIDAFCAENGIRPTLIKSDTEGNDLFVLQGAIETIKQYHPFLLVEYSAENTAQYGYNPSEIITFIEALDYTFIMPEGLDVLAVPRNWENLIK